MVFTLPKQTGFMGFWGNKVALAHPCGNGGKYRLGKVGV